MGSCADLPIAAHNHKNAAGPALAPRYKPSDSLSFFLFFSFFFFFTMYIYSSSDDLKIALEKLLLCLSPGPK